MYISEQSFLFPKDNSSDTLWAGFGQFRIFSFRRVGLGTQFVKALIYLSHRIMVSITEFQYAND